MHTIVQVGAVAAALLAIGGAVRGGWWLVRQLVHIADAVQELKPNGGGSIKDAINRIDERTKSLDERVTALEVGIPIALGTPALTDSQRQLIAPLLDGDHDG